MSGDSVSARRHQDYCSVADDYRLSSVQLSAQVHKAIRDGDYAWLPDLIPQNSTGASTLLWEPNSSGWTAVHYAASHFLPREWWRWLLVRAAVDTTPSFAADVIRTEKSLSAAQRHAFARNKFVSVRNDLGETVFDIFFRSFLAPLPWQSTNVKNCSKLLCQAIQKICHEKDDDDSPDNLLQQVRDELEKENSLHVGENKFAWSNAADSGIEALSSTPVNITVERCVVFCRNLQLLCQAAHEIVHTKLGNEDKRTQFKKSEFFPFPSVLSFLAQNTGGCPEPVAALLLKLYPEQAHTPLRQHYKIERSPSSAHLLHIWSAYNQPCYKSLKGMLSPLLQAFPEAASISEPETGRYPLHHAMASGNKSWHCIQPIFEAAPFVLQCIDPTTGFYPVFLVAMAAQRCGDPLAVEIRARQNSAGEKGLVSLWYISPVESRQEALQRAAKELECEAVESIYLALRAFPRALTDH